MVHSPSDRTSCCPKNALDATVLTSICRILKGINAIGNFADFGISSSGSLGFDELTNRKRLGLKVIPM